MTETCSKCGRPKPTETTWADAESIIAAAKYGWCEGERTMACREQAAGFIRGATWMLETAKRGAAIVGPECDRHIGWSGPEAALEARGK